jgi:hypothetical protein
MVLCSVLRDPSIDTASTAARRLLDDVYMAIDDLRANDTKSATAAIDGAFDRNSMSTTIHGQRTVHR